MPTIRVMLIDARGEKSYIECKRVSQGQEGGVECVRPGSVNPCYAGAIAQEVAKGYLSGLTAGYHWYRQAGNSRELPAA